MADWEEPQTFSFPAPIHPVNPGTRPPRSILLDPYAYLSPRTNGTTAKGSTRDGHIIMITFWPAAPPRVSCFTLYCPGLNPSAIDTSPTIIAMHDDLVLFRVPILHPQGVNLPETNHHIVYQAGTKRKEPSLTVIPTLCLTLGPSDLDYALLSCRDRGMFFVAVLNKPFIDWEKAHAEGRYDLHLYNSKTGRWSKKPMYVNRSSENFLYSCPDKTITIGGKRGSVGWVDLWRGMLICDLLVEKENNLRYVPVPAQLLPMQRPTFGMATRDIIVAKGCIKFFEMHTYTRPGSNVTEWWEGVAKKMKFSSIGVSNNWEEDCDLRNCEVPVPVNNLEYAQFLPDLLQRGEEDTEPTLKGSFMAYPALCLHDDGVVYLMKILDSDTFDKALVLAVDMRNKTLKGVAEIGGCGRCVDYTYKYRQTSISRHLSICSSTRKWNGADALENGTAVSSGSQEISKDDVQPLHN